MAPEDIAADRPVRIVEKSGPGSVLFSSTKTGSLVRCENARGSFEVLVPADRVSSCEHLLEASNVLDLRGFWRRRSGFRENGQRHFIWTLVLIEVNIRPDKIAA